MALKKFGCLWTLGLCLLATRSVKVPLYTSKQFIKECVDTHNQLRGMVDPPAADMRRLSWDERLAKLAKAWSTKCELSHNPCSEQRYGCNEEYEFIGENIWLGKLKEFSVTDAITSWFNESKYYDFDNERCSQVCGHYTQGAWANTYEVGCAVTNCPHLGNTSTALFICNYGPGGNYGNTPPYTKGESCSLCLENEACRNNLCETLSAKSPQLKTYHLLSLCFTLHRIF